MKITKEQQEQINKIGEKYQLRFIIIHGSYASGEEKKGSDLDVAILGREKVEFSRLLAIHGEMGRIFGDNKTRELDLKTLHDKDPLFIFQAVSKGMLIYGDKHDYSFFEALSIRKYLSNNKIFKLEDILIKKALQNI